MAIRSPRYPQLGVHLLLVQALVLLRIRLVIARIGYCVPDLLCCQEEPRKPGEFGRGVVCTSTVLPVPRL